MVQKLTGKCLCEGIAYEITGELGPIFNCHFGVPLGGIEQTPNNQVEGHIFVSSKSPWYEIIDDLPQYEHFHEKVREVAD